MNKIFVTSFIALLQSLVFTQSNDLVTPVSIINDGLDTQAQMGSVFTLDGTNSYDSNGTIVSYFWSQSPNGTQVEFSSENDSIVTFTVPTESDANPNMPGGSGDVICIIWLTVTDNDGLTNMSQITITGVEGEPPVSIINDGSSHVSVQIGSQFTLDGSNSYDLDGTITEYSWSQSQNGDQVVFSSTDETVVTFTVPEESPNDISDSSVTCIIYLTVTDNVGNTDMSQITVTGTLSGGSQQLDSSIEGRWFPRGFDNTMYEFLDGLRYTYYCPDENGCDSTYWNSVDTSDALPTINPYTVDGNTISIDLFFGTIATYELGFRCEGQVVDFYYDEDDWAEGLHSTMYRQGFDSENNECLNTDPNNCICTQEYNPVCGVDGNTYPNPCYATCQYVVIAHEGECLVADEGIEGRWFWGYELNSTPNTMYELLDGIRYTYYCDQNECDSTYWNSLDTSDAIPNPNPYTFINDTLTINLFFGNTWETLVTFECNGDIASFSEDASNYWWRASLDTNNCEYLISEQQLTLSKNINIPKKFTVHQNYPNPFNPVTNLSYDLPKDLFVSITIYDMLGNVVNNLVNTNQSSGYKSVQWDATNNQGQPVSAGIYLYSIEANGFRQTKKMILLK